MKRISAKREVGERPESFSRGFPGRPGTLASHRRTVEKVILGIAQRLEEDLSLEELAGLAAMSPYHFHRVFRTLTGLPPGQFVSALRLERAKHLLLADDREVTDICYGVGYKSLGTFTSRFTELVGLPPTQFRQLGRTFRLEDLDDLWDLAQGTDAPGGTEIAGRVEARDPFRGIVFLGLFPQALPRQRPLACALAAGPGPYRLAAPADGRYFLFAVGLSWPAADPVDYLLCNRSVCGVASAGPVLVRGGRARGEATLELRPPELLDPPLLLTLPLLIRQRSDEKEQARRSVQLAADVP
jgi:AraC family transcriptional regulator